MGLLEVPRMLRLLTIILFLFFQQTLYAQNNFIDSKVNFFQEQLPQKTTEPTIKTKATILNTENCTTCSFLEVESAQEFPYINSKSEGVIKLFIDPDCKYSQEAIKILKETLKVNTDLKGQVYLIAPFKSLIPFSQKNQDLVSDEISIILDTEKTYKKQYKITATPSFIVEAKGKIY